MLFAVSSNGGLFKNVTVQTILPFYTRAEQVLFKMERGHLGNFRNLLLGSLHGLVSDIYNRPCGCLESSRAKGLLIIVAKAPGLPCLHPNLQCPQRRARGSSCTSSCSGRLPAQSVSYHWGEEECFSF